MTPRPITGHTARLRPHNAPAMAHDTPTGIARAHAIATRPRTNCVAIAPVTWVHTLTARSR